MYDPSDGIQFALISGCGEDAIIVTAVIEPLILGLHSTGGGEGGGLTTVTVNGVVLCQCCEPKTVAYKLI